MAAIEFFNSSYFASANCKAYYRFTSGALTTDSKGSNTLTAISDPAEDASGVFDGAVALDTNDAYSCPDNSADWMVTGNFSVGAWVKNSATAVNHYIAQASSFNPNVAGWWFSINTSGKLSFASGRNTGTTLHTDYEQAATTTTGISLTDGVWHFVVGVYDGYKLRTYVDGVLQATKSWVYYPVYDTTTYIRIGQNKRSSSAALYHFNGSLDDVWIINQALTSDDISYLYSGIPASTLEKHQGFKLLGYISQTPDPGADLCTGMIMTLTAHEAFTLGQVGYINSEGEIALADASAIATSSAVVMATSAIGANSSGIFLTSGVIHLHSLAPSWTRGSLIYLSESAGALTATAPTTTNSVTQIIGVALDTDILLLNPQLSQTIHS